MKIQVGSAVERIIGNDIEIWKITRIELNDNTVSIFACRRNWYDKHQNTKKLYDEDELWGEFNSLFKLPSGEELKKRQEADERLRKFESSDDKFPKDLFGPTYK